MAIFDFLLKNPREEARQASRVAAQDLAGRKFDAQQKADADEKIQKEFEFKKRLLDDPNLSDRAKQALGLSLSQSPQLAGLTKQVRQGNRAQAEGLVEPAKASLFDSLRSGNIPLQDVPQAVQGAGKTLQGLVDQPVNLFDFADQKPKIEGDFIEGTVTSTDKDGNVKVIQAPRSARDLTFERLSPAEQEAIVKKGQSTTVNVAVGDGKEAVTKTIRSKLQESIIKLDNDIASIDSIEKNFEDQFLTIPGKLRAGSTALAEKFNIPPATTEKFLKKVGIIDKEDEDFMRRQAAFMLPAFTLLNEKIKEITGAAVREGEEGRLGKSTVDPQVDSPTQFRAKAATIKSIMIRQRKEKAILLQRGLPYDKVNVESIPVDSVDSIFREEVLKLPQSPKQKLQNQANVVKQSNSKDNATIINAPSEKTQPQTLTDKIALRDVSKAVGKENGIRVEELLVSHPQSISAMQGLIKEEKMNLSEVGRFLKIIKDKGLSDEQVLKRLAGMRGGQ